METTRIHDTLDTMLRKKIMEHTAYPPDAIRIDDLNFYGQNVNGGCLEATVDKDGRIALRLWEDGSWSVVAWGSDDNADVIFEADYEAQAPGGTPFEVFRRLTQYRNHLKLKLNAI